MKTHINYQVIKKDGAPEYAIVPYEEFMALVGDEPTIPHGVVALTVDKNYSLIRAWREYLGMTQGEVAEKVGVTQPALAQMEKPGARLRKTTIAKLAKALGVDPLQLKL